MSTTNTKIWFLVFALGALFGGCATENQRVSQHDMNDAQLQLIIHQHEREIGDYVLNAYRTLGPDQTKWTKAQFTAYIRGLYGLFAKYGYGSNP